MKRAIKRAASPEDMGLNGEALPRFFEKTRKMGIHSLALARDQQIYAQSVSPWHEDAPHTLFSLSKSFCSMAAGLAVEEGLLSYEDSVADILQSSLPKDYDPRLHEVKLRHLLSMSSGLDPKSNLRSLREKIDWARETLSFRVLHDPGTTFFYNTHGTYLAGRMVAEKTGQTLRDYLTPRLFQKLGISKPQWDCCPLGYNVAGFGLNLSAMDLAKVGQLLLFSGKWEGETVLPPAYLAQATRKQVETAALQAKEHWADWESGYGWQFWMGQNGRYRGDGMFGQVLMIDPVRNLALAVTAGLNLMGDEVNALHILMNELTGPVPFLQQGQKEPEAIKARLYTNEPADDGGALPPEGSYLDPGNRLLRLETPDNNTLRLFYKGRGQKRQEAFVFGREEAHRGEYCSGRQGEGPQPYLGRFGVQNGVLELVALMPQAAYTISIRIKPDGDGLDVQMDNVGFDSGHFYFKTAH